MNGVYYATFFKYEIALKIFRNRIYITSGDSMLPNVGSGQHILVTPANFSKFSRGDVLVIRDPNGTKNIYLKRLVGLPCEEVKIFDGSLFINGVHLKESYLGGMPQVLGLGKEIWKLKDREVFVLGDNRARSTDSKDFGPVSFDFVEYKAWFCYWPTDRIGFI